MSNAKLQIIFKNYIKTLFNLTSFTLLFFQNQLNALMFSKAHTTKQLLTPFSFNIFNNSPHKDLEK